jgi:hypothetical protein
MYKIKFNTTGLDEQTITAMDAMWQAAMATLVPATLTSIEQVASRLRQTQRLLFRFAEFESETVLWQQVGPRAAIVQQRQEHLLRWVHLLSWTPTGEVIWERQQTEAVTAPPDDFGDLLGMLVLVPIFVELTDGAAASETDGCRLA